MSYDFCKQEMDSSKCMACEIVSEAYVPPGGIVYENREFVIHQDPLVAIPGFMIISPRRHVFSIDALTNLEKRELGFVISLVEEAIKKSTNVKYFSIIQEDCIAEGHLHFWVFPWHSYIINEYGVSLNQLRVITTRYRKDMRYLEETLEIAKLIKDYLSHTKGTEYLFDYHGLNLCDQDFAGMDLSHANFEGAVLKRCNFSGCNLSFANFNNADLYRACFCDATLYATTYKGADLTRADFRNAVLYGAKIFGADLSHTIFDNIIIEERNKNYEKAEDVYNTIKRAYSENGNKEESAKYYYKQRVAKRKQRKGLARFFDWFIADRLIGYGERLGRCITASLLVIISFCSIYLLATQFTDIAGAVISSLSVFFGFNPVGAVSAIESLDVVFAIERLLGYFLIALALIGVARKIVRD